ATADEAAAFVDDVLAAQILVCDLQPRLTGADMLGGVVAALRAAAPAATATAMLEDARAELDALDAMPLGAAPARYRSLAARVHTAAGVTPEPAQPFHVDLYKPAPDAR